MFQRPFAQLVRREVVAAVVGNHGSLMSMDGKVVQL